MSAMSCDDPATQATDSALESMESVFCKYCSTVKSISSFTASNISRGCGADGLRAGRCKPCHQQYNQAYRSSKPRIYEPTVRYKECSKCDKTKAAAEYFKDAATEDGLAKQCKEFVSAKPKYTFTPAPMVTEKTCYKCHEVKPAAEFHGHIRCKDGLNSSCKACCAANQLAKSAGLQAKRKQGLLVEHVAFKVCQRCKLGKSASDFSRDVSQPDGLYHACKACRSKYNKERKAAAKERGPTVSHKTCKACGQQKAAADFSENAHRSDGLHHNCKACHAAKATEKNRAKAAAVKASGPLPVAVTSKRCPGCKEVKPADCFNRSYASASGLGEYCKPCKNVRDKESRMRSKARQQQQLEQQQQRQSDGVAEDSVVAVAAVPAAAAAAATATTAAPANASGSESPGGGAGSAAVRKRGREPASGLAAASQEQDSKRLRNSAGMQPAAGDSLAQAWSTAAAARKRGRCRRSSSTTSSPSSRSGSDSDCTAAPAAKKRPAGQQPTASTGGAAAATADVVMQPTPAEQQQLLQPQEQPLQPQQQPLQPQQQAAGPQLLPGQIQVLGQTMTAAVAAAFRQVIAAQEEGLNVELLTRVRPKSLHTAILKQVKAYMSRHVPLSRGSAALSNWPASLPLHPAVEAYTLPPRPAGTHVGRSGRPLPSCPLVPDAQTGSSRSLSSQRGVRVRSAEAGEQAEHGRQQQQQPTATAGDVIGPFSGVQAFGHEMPGIAAKPLPGWAGTVQQWQLQLDAFSLSQEAFRVPQECCEEEAAIAQASGQPLGLAVCALLHSNETALINDPRPDPLKQPNLSARGPQPNVMAVEVEVGGWAFPFVVALCDIAAGQELLLDYGKGYWLGRQAELQAAAEKGVTKRRPRKGAVQEPVAHVGEPA